jgi:hypothetical protein
MICGTIQVENWIEKRRVARKKRESTEQVIKFKTNDLKKKLKFIEDSVKHKHCKPFFTDMWGAIILGGKNTYTTTR